MQLFYTKNFETLAKWRENDIKEEACYSIKTLMSATIPSKVERHAQGVPKYSQTFPCKTMRVASVSQLLSYLHQSSAVAIRFSYDAIQFLHGK